MTSTEPMTYKPGPELDRIVAEKVMGYTMYHYDKDVEENCYYILLDESGEPVVWEAERRTEEEAWADCPKFSTTWEGMQQVVERMTELGYWIEVSIGRDYDTATVGKKGKMLGRWYSSPNADKAPHAVAEACLSALQHVSKGLDGGGDNVEQ